MDERSVRRIVVALESIESSLQTLVKYHRFLVEEMKRGNDQDPLSIIDQVLQDQDRVQSDQDMEIAIQIADEAEMSVEEWLALREQGKIQ